MITGVEIDFIVPDSVKALETYERIFPVERLEVTGYAVGQNEAVFTIFGSRFHLLDENPEYQMLAPHPGASLPVWFNVVVPDIRDTWAKAMVAGCTAVQPVTEMEPMGVINAMFTDPFGYVWMLHQVLREVSFAERCRIMETQMGGGA